MCCIEGLKLRQVLIKTGDSYVIYITVYLDEECFLSTACTFYFPYIRKKKESEHSLSTKFIRYWIPVK